MIGCREEGPEECCARGKERGGALLGKIIPLPAVATSTLARASRSQSASTRPRWPSLPFALLAQGVVLATAECRRADRRPPNVTNLHSFVPVAAGAETVDSYGHPRRLCVVGQLGASFRVTVVLLRARALLIRILALDHLMLA